MENKRKFISYIAAVFVLSQAFVLQAQERRESQHVVYLSIAPVPVPPQRERGRPLVFDNELLDRLFSKDRLSKDRGPNQEADKDRNVRSGDARPNEPATTTDQLTEKNASAKTRPAGFKPTESFSDRITPKTPSNQAAALRFAEQGRKFLSEGQPKRALGCFEKAMAIGLHRYLPYVYYYLARTHYHLSNFQSSRNFLEVAETLLSEQPEWVALIAAVKDDFNGGGMRIAANAY
jgi:tetratricopeptide (TPR) repeat protein